MKQVTAICAFLGGAVVGAAVGLLLAPEKGADTRTRIADILREKGIKLDGSELSEVANKIAQHVHPTKGE